MTRPAFGLDLDQAKRLFFDRDRVISAVDRGRLRYLRRAGGFTRKTARRSIRKRKKASRPGQPPSSHTGALRKIFFGLDTRDESVAVGPVKLNKVYFDGHFKPQTGTVPEVLEFGGRYQVVEEWNGFRFVRRDLRRKGAVADVDALRRSNRSNVFQGRPIRRRTVEIAARPYMGPALETVSPRLPEFWRDAVLPKAA